MSISELVEHWRDEAAILDRRGATKQAEVLESVADELEDFHRTHGDEILTPTEAAAESGYSAEHLRRLIREGTIPNAGAKNRPKIRRAHLPRKPGHRLGGRRPDRIADSASQVVRSAVESE